MIAPVSSPPQHSLAPWAVGAFALVCIALGMYRQSSSLPPASIPSEAAMIKPEGLLAPGEAMASNLTPDDAGKAIYLNGQSGRIIGRLAKIPAESEQITEIRPLSQVDKNAGRELLSIVGKY